MVNIEYKCHDRYAEVTFNVDGEEYTQRLSGEVPRERLGKPEPGRAYRCRNKRAIIEKAWGLLRSEYDELEYNNQVLVKIGEIPDISCPPNCPKLFHL